MRRTNLFLLMAMLAGCGAAPAADDTNEGFTAGSIGRGPYFLNWLSAPTNLQQSFNSQDCNQHIPAPWNVWGGTQGCAAALQSGQILLDWSWKHGAPPLVLGGPALHDVGIADGYHVYAALAGNPPVKWDEQTTNADWTVKAVAAGPSGVQTCFTVRAYKGAVESDPTNPVCMIGSGRQAVQTATLSPVATRSLNTDGGDEFHSGEAGPAAGQVRVGYHHHFDYEPIGANNYFYWDWRAGLRFDLGSLQGRPILGATLHLHQTALDEVYVTPQTQTCLQEVGFAVQDFMALADGAKLDVDVQYAVDPSVPNPSLDVTQMVRSWVQGARPNNGFALDNQKFGYAPDSANCESTFDQLTLEVSYF